MILLVLSVRSFVHCHFSDVLQLLIVMDRHVIIAVGISMLSYSFRTEI